MRAGMREQGLAAVEWRFRGSYSVGVTGTIDKSCAKVV